MITIEVYIDVSDYGYSNRELVYRIFDGKQLIIVMGLFRCHG